MNSKGHLTLSLLKSIIRLFGCCMAVYNNNFSIAFLMFAIAEGLGVAEELVDKR